MVLLPSQEVKNISLNCEATLGRVSNSIHAQTKLGKAGASR
jgi:ribosomal protein L2